MRKCVQDLEKFLNKWYITFPQTSFLLLCPVYCLTPSNSLSLIFSDLSDPDLFFDSGLLLWQWLDKLRNNPYLNMFPSLSSISARFSLTKGLFFFFRTPPTGLSKPLQNLGFHLNLKKPTAATARNIFLKTYKHRLKWVVAFSAVNIDSYPLFWPPENIKQRHLTKGGY